MADKMRPLESNLVKAPARIVHRESSKGPGQMPTETAEHKYRHLYKHAPDFKELSLLDGEFATVVNGRDLDFSDPIAVKQLTKTLLKLDFGLEIELPDDRLCPPVANRHNYILWLKDLMDSTSYSEPGRKLVGLDIGTGASCIYPLLGCTQRPWSFIATDIDAESLSCAAKNIKLNGLETRIQLVARQPHDAVIPLDDLQKHSIDFTMTNPPFYRSERELIESAEKKSRAPFTACTGAKVEMVTEGGEVGFAERILTESLVLRERVQWYTSMFGFLSSVTYVIGKLKEEGIDNYAVTEFVQGNKTRRWAVAWSFQSLRPAQDVARGTKAALSKSILPLITEAEVLKLPQPESVKAFADSLTGAISALELVSWQWNAETFDGTGRAADKVWSRAWRRRNKRKETDDKKYLETADEPKSAFGFKVSIRMLKDGLSVTCRWLEGHDGVAFESFQGFLKTSAQSAASS